MKVVAFDEICNFIVYSFSIGSHLHSQIIDILTRSQFSYRDLSFQFMLKNCNSFRDLKTANCSISII
jgi:hypothetical protein